MESCVVLDKSNSWKQYSRSVWMHRYYEEQSQYVIYTKLSGGITAHDCVDKEKKFFFTKVVFISVLGLDCTIIVFHSWVDVDICGVSGLVPFCCLCALQSSSGSPPFLVLPLMAHHTSRLFISNACRPRCASSALKPSAPQTLHGESLLFTQRHRLACSATLEQN